VTAGDQGVKLARDTLAYYDRGMWTDPVNTIGHLAAAVRMLLEYVDQDDDDSAGKLAAVRAVLARFDWEHDDRQYALEEIDRIAGGAS
jgi:hypothetical protein